MNKQKYYNWKSLFYEEKHYDFIIGEHLKGKKYAMEQQKSLINQTKEVTFNGEKK